jgi:Flp pilus assembly protein TadG
MSMQILPKVSRRKLRAVGKRDSGQALVELGLILPVLLLLLIGVIEIGRYAYIGILIGNAARAGAAFGAQSIPQSGDTVGISAAATNDFASNGQGSTLNVVSNTTCGCDSGGTFTSAASCASATCPTSAHWVINVNVTASGTFSGLFNYPGIPSSLDISRKATLRVAQN